MERFVPGPENGLAYRSALGRFATGVTVVTCLSEQGPLGFTANSFASVSLDPPLVLWSPAKESSRHDAFVVAENFNIHVLSEDQGDLCAMFSKDGFDFEGLALQPGHDVPLLAGCLAHFECSLFAAHDAGDHTIVVGKVEAAAQREGSPLVFSSGAMGTFHRV